MTQIYQKPFWEPWMSTESVFCQAVVKCGYLTEDQMLRAAERYRLGRSRDGGVIFWQIDDRDRTRDGKIMYYREDCHRDKSRHPSWASARLKAHYGYDGELPVDRCLFGLHLLETYPQPLPIMEGSGYPQGKSSADEHFTSPPELGGVSEGRGGLNKRSFRPPLTPPESGGETAIAVVEAEKTAVIMSEVYPQYVWMAAGGLSALSAEKLHPLRDHKVVLGAEGGEDRYRRFTVQPKTMTFGNIRNPFLREVGAGHALLPKSPDACRRTEQPELLDPSLYGSQRCPQGLRHGPQGQVVHTEGGSTHHLLPR